MLKLLQNTKKLNYIQRLTISVIALLLAACSTGTQSTDSPTPSGTSSSTQTTASPVEVTISGISNVREIKFNPTTLGNSPNGFFDAINGSTTQKIEVSKGSPITASGWAVLVDEDKPADQVIVTYGDNNSLVAVAPVKLERQDVAKNLKNNAYTNSGWSITFNSSVLPPGKVILKAWAYNPTRKQATQLNYTHEVVVLNK